MFVHTGPKQTPPTSEPVKPSVDSDTDYNSGSSRSSSLETTPTLKQDKALPNKVHVGRSRDRISESYVSKSSTLERPQKSSLTSSYDSQRDKRVDTSLRSATLGRRTTIDATATRSVADRKRATSSKLASPDVTSLNPATIQSLEKLERIKQQRDYRRPRTPEPHSPKVTQTKLMVSPERLSRRKSLGNHPIGPIGHLICPATTLPEEPEIVETHDDDSPSAAKVVEQPLPTEKKLESIVIITEDTEAIKKDDDDGAVTVSPKEDLVSVPKEEPVTKQTTEEVVKTDEEDLVSKVDHAPPKKEGISRTMSTPPKLTSPSNERRSKYKSSTDNIFMHRTPVESVWGSFRTENTASSFHTKTKMDDSWRVKTPTSVSPLPSRRKYDTSPSTSRSNTPTSPPVRKPGDPVKRENSFGSRSSTPTSPVVKDTDKQGRSSPRQTYPSIGRVISPPLPKIETTKAPENIVVAPKESPKVPTSQSPTPPSATEVVVRTRLTTSPGRDYRRPKSRDSEAARALKIEQRKTPVLTPEALEALDNMLKCGITDDNDMLETCVEEDEEIAPKKSFLKFETPAKKVSINSEPCVVVDAPTPNTEIRPALGVYRQSLSDRSKSLGTLGNERNSSPVCPEEGESPSDAFSNSMSSRLSLGGGKSFASRHSFSGMSTSFSMTDLSQVGKKKSKARRVGRSNSKRMIGYSAIDSYVADTRTSPSHRTSGGSLSIASSGLQTSSSRTLPARVLSGTGIDTKEKKSTEKRFRFFSKK